MPSLYDRRYILSLAGQEVLDLTATQEVRGLQIEFDITKTRGKEPDTATVTVSNLSEETRRRLSDSDNPSIVLEAGYVENIAQIFQGKALRVTSQRQGPDWKTTIEAGDGTAQIQRSQSQIKFPSGGKLTNIIGSLVDEVGLSIGNLRDKIQDKGLSAGFTEYVNGFTHSGNSHEAIGKIAESLGLKVTVQDEQYIAVDAIDGTTEKEAYRLAPDSGLIGSPELGDKGTVRAVSFLLPDLRPNDPVIMGSADIDGRYRVEKIQHVGSYRGSDWLSNVDLRPIP